jgi:hypothetical protein
MVGTMPLATSLISLFEWYAFGTGQLPAMIALLAVYGISAKVNYNRSFGEKAPVNLP